jgi:hypothetical protein
MAMAGGGIAGAEHGPVPLWVPGLILIAVCRREFDTLRQQNVSHISLVEVAVTSPDTDAREP